MAELMLKGGKGKTQEKEGKKLGNRDKGEIKRNKRREW